MDVAHRSREPVRPGAVVQINWAPEWLTLGYRVLLSVHSHFVSVHYEAAWSVAAQTLGRNGAVCARELCLGPQVLLHGHFVWM